MQTAILQFRLGECLIHVQRTALDRKFLLLDNFYSHSLEETRLVAGKLERLL